VWEKTTTRKRIDATKLQRLALFGNSFPLTSNEDDSEREEGREKEGSTPNLYLYI